MLFRKHFSERERERERERKIERKREREYSPNFFATFNITISHIFPENVIDFRHFLVTNEIMTAI